MLDLVLLQLSVPLHHVVLQLYVSLNVRYVSLGVAPRFLIVLVDLASEAIVDALLQLQKVLLPVVSNFLELSLQVMRALLLHFQEVLVLFVGVFELLELVDVLL